MSSAPTHPELLDWLAATFVENKWSIKALHRTIVLSAAYQQSGQTNPAYAEKDPNNKLLWRFNLRRMDFEELHDSLLAVTGELDLEMGGKPVELFGKKPVTRRTVYGYIDRQFLPGVFRVFDFANPDLHIPQRSDTTVPQQALFFMNNAFVVERARALINRPDVQERRDSADRIRQLYRLVYQREPTKTQLRLGLDFVQSSISEPPSAPVTPIASAWQYGYGEYDESAQTAAALHGRRLAGRTKLAGRKAWMGPAHRRRRSRGQRSEARGCPALGRAAGRDRLDLGSRET
jgi:hypothetical protein